MYTNCFCITICGCTNERLRSFGYSFAPLLSLPLFEALKEWLAVLIVLSCSGLPTAIGSRVGSSLSPEEHRCLNWTQEKEINTSTWNLPTEASTLPSANLHCRKSISRPYKKRQYVYMKWNCVWYMWKASGLIFDCVNNKNGCGKEGHSLDSLMWSRY